MVLWVLFAHFSVHVFIMQIAPSVILYFDESPVCLYGFTVSVL